MQFIHYIGGETRSKKLVAVGLALSNDPVTHLASLKGTMPFELRTMAVEQGTPSQLEQLKETFKAAHLNGFWYKPSPALVAHVEAVESVDPALGKMTRVSLDLTPEEFAALEKLVGESGTKSKAQLLRKALRFYRVMHAYKAQGYGIQAVRGGKMIQFPDLDAAG